MQSQLIYFAFVVLVLAVNLVTDEKYDVQLHAFSTLKDVVCVNRAYGFQYPAVYYVGINFRILKIGGIY